MRALRLAHLLSKRIAQTGGFAFRWRWGGRWSGDVHATSAQHIYGRLRQILDGKHILCTFGWWCLVYVNSCRAIAERARAPNKHINYAHLGREMGRALGNELLCVSGVRRCDAFFVCWCERVCIGLSCAYDCSCSRTHARHATPGSCHHRCK